MINNYYISTLIRDLRNNCNFTLQEVANYLGVSKVAVSKWENGDDISTEHLYKLSKLYNVTFSELIVGKLNTESSSDYWKRNYDLSNFEINEEITNKNVDNLKTFFEQCNAVKDRFFKLLPYWANNNINNDQLEEFKFIKQYFQLDYTYYNYVTNGIIGNIGLGFYNDKKEKGFVVEILNQIKNYDKDSYYWELTKLYNFSYNYDKQKILESRNMKALEYMLSSFSQIEKDSILYANLHIKEQKEIETPFGGKAIQFSERDRTIEEIEKMSYFNVMLNSGANVLYQYKSYSEIMDYEIFNKIEGKIVEIDESIYNKYLFSDFGGQKFIPILESWKLYSYNDYLVFINKDETERLKDIVNLKDSEPLKYYENLIKRSYTNVK